MKRKLMRAKMKSVFAKVKDRWKKYAKKEREEKRVPVSFAEYMRVS